jgi:CRISPR type I-E-associated protein CasB/Cse2
MIPEAVQLARRLGALTGNARPDDARIVRALDLARVLAHVKETDVAAPMRVAGWRSFPADQKSEAGDDRPKLAEPRFQRLLQAEEGEERVTAFTRLIALLGGQANVTRIAEDFWYWNDRTKHRWAFEYYAAAVATPPDDPTALEENEA